MITSIHLQSVATFGPSKQPMNDLSLINFIYGPNGVGKTTISKLISGTLFSEHCKITWANEKQLRTFVYNRDFIEQNFNQSPDLKGVFTLGEENILKIKEIDSLKEAIAAKTSKIQALRASLGGENGAGGKVGELNSIVEHFREVCWKAKTKYEVEFRKAFDGFLNKEKFRNKVLSELSNNSVPEALDAMQKKAAVLFNEQPPEESVFQLLDSTTVEKDISSSILSKLVVGKQNLNISKLVEHLKNSDWIRQGIPYLDQSKPACPFCQQNLPADFEAQLNEYFDQSYARDVDEIKRLKINHLANRDDILRQIENIRRSSSKYLNKEFFALAYEKLKSIFDRNTQILTKKETEPSISIELESLKSSISEINEEIEKTNTSIREHNKMIEDFSSQRSALISKIWKYIVDVDLKQEISSYHEKKAGVETGIGELQRQIEQLNIQIEQSLRDIKVFEKQTTTAKPTLHKINELLLSLGFHSFSLRLSKNEISYTIVREDGTEAKSSLSEGEKTFLTFIYFYHILNGSQSSSGLTDDRVVVFDDPVSSLDSDVLFVVGSLIKQIFESIRSNKGNVKQAFVLTHNVYFHKEVTYNSRRRDNAMSEETFWILRKVNKLSIIEKQPTNPIKTSYELLWLDVRTPNPQNLTIQNTLRRILENYFRILGGINIDNIPDHFTGNEKIICRMLISWMHDGSHYAHDDLHVTVNNVSVENYLCVFKQIFIKLGHIDHYKMMMGNSYVESTEQPPAVPAALSEPRSTTAVKPVQSSLFG